MSWVGSKCEQWNHVLSAVFCLREAAGQHVAQSQVLARGHDESSSYLILSKFMKETLKKIFFFSFIEK